MAGPVDFLPPSFWAASISCLSLLSLFLLDLLFLGPLGSCLLLLLLGPDLLPGGLFVLEPLELGLLLGPFFPPLRDVLLQLLVHL